MRNRGATSRPARSTPRALSPRRRRLFVAAALAGSLVVGALAAELTLRATSGAPPRWTWPQERYRADPEIGHALRPDQAAFTHGAPVEINSAGVRGPEYTPYPPPGVRRVLAIGDSQTFGNGLPLEQTWTAQLEASLEARDGPGSWEVINAGIPGTDTWQHETVLRRMLERYHPHEVVLAFYVNDVQSSVEPEWLYPPARLEPSARAIRRATYLAKRSALVNALWDAARAVRQWNAGPTKEYAVLTGAPDERAEAGWNQARESLGRMRDAAHAAGAGFVVLALPHRDQVSGAIEATAYNERLARFADELGLPLVDALGALSEAWEARTRTLFIPWDGHQSGTANAVVAREMIAEVFADRTAAGPAAAGRARAGDEGRPRLIGMR